MSLLTLDHVSLSLDDKPILHDLSIDFWKGHVHAVVGPNGAGKSTLAATIMGLAGYREFDGDILFDGKSIKDQAIDERARQGITLGWQEPARFIEHVVPGQQPQPQAPQQQEPVLEIPGEREPAAKEQGPSSKPTRAPAMPPSAHFRKA